jgi:putative glutamine amidotransferase
VGVQPSIKNRKSEIEQQSKIRESNIRNRPMPPIIALPPYARLRDYETAITLAGGEPRRLEIGRDNPADVIREVDALLLPGGGDVEPSRYGETRHRTFDAAEEGRDEFETELAQRARDVNMPILAICRGLQLLNVSRGGSLIQDIPDQVSGALNHARREPPDAIAHGVQVRGGSRLAALLFPDAPVAPAQVVAVNSRHHQAIKAVGEGLVVTATAADGVIEAVEDPAMAFCLAVQWHPENFHRTGEFKALFEAFVTASQRARARRCR